jgi:predicted component of type VI protein secretion system
LRSKNLSLYDVLVGCFISEGHNPLDVTPADLEKLPEDDKLHLSIAENLKLVLQTRCGEVLHLRDAGDEKPDFGMPDFWEIYANYRNKNEALIQSFKNRLQKTILKYETRISKVEFDEKEEKFDANSMRIALRIVATIKDADRHATLRTEFSTSGWTTIELERETI